MKKIYLLLAMLLGFFGSMVTFAQAGGDSEFTNLKTVQIGEAQADFSPNTWYFFYQGRQSNGTTDTYTQCSVGDYPEDGGGVLADCGIGKDLLKKSAGDVIEAQPANRYAAYVVRFIPVNGKDGGYNIQFGTGNYMSEPAGSGNSQKFTTTDNIYDAGVFNIYNIDENDPGHFGFNVYNFGQRIDNNGTGYTVVTWGDGKHESVEKSNSIWSVHEVEWGESDAYQAALAELQLIYNEYSAYGEEDYFPIGTDIGDYDGEAVAAFQAALNAAAEADSGPELEISQLQALGQAIIDTYEAVIATKVPLTLADGYYRIRGALKYTNNVKVGVDPETGQDITEEQEVDKYIVSIQEGEKIYAKWNTPANLSSDGASLWKVTNKDGFFDIVNVATQARFNDIATSEAATMSVESEKLMALDFVVKLEDVMYVDIRVSTQEANNYYYLHQGGHGGGTGVSGNIVGWSTSYNKSTETFGGTEWTFDAVPDDEVAAIMEAYEIIRNHDLLVSNYSKMLEDAQQKLETAKDLTVTVDEESPFISDVSQFSSPWTETSEGSIDALIDGDAQTFWHSSWSGGNVANHTHYLQVELNEPAHQLLALQFTRRPVANDHITLWSVYGSNDAEAEDGEWVKLASLKTPFTSNTETITTWPFDTKSNQYLRFYIDGTTTGRGYGHVSEFQLYPGEILDPATSQYHMLGAVATNLEKVIADQEGIDLDALTVDQYNALKDVYDAFIAKFVDPAPLRTAITGAEELAGNIVIGNNPGFWSSDSGATRLTEAVTSAKSYDKAGVYTAEASDSHIKSLKDLSDDIYATANKIKTGKWYRIRFATEEIYDEYGWDKVAGNGDESSEELWGKYITVADYYSEDGVDYHEASEPESITLGHKLYFDAEDDIVDDELSQFRFIAVGDTAYMIQNRMTGMFIKCGTTGATTLSVHPSLFNVSAIGCGFNLLAAKGLKGENQNYLHAQVAANTLVTWNATTLGSRSALLIEEVADVAADYDGTQFNIGLEPGSLSSFCFPVEISTSSKGLYGLGSIDGSSITLTPIDGTVAAGRPFFYVHGNLDEYDSETEEDLSEPVAFRHAYDVVAEPFTSGILKGTFASTTVGSGVVVASGNHLEVLKKSSNTVGANRAYIQGNTPFNLETEVVLVIDDAAQDGVAATLANVAKTGELYTIDGRLISRKANLNSLRTMGRGVYILNGTKVTVK